MLTAESETFDHFLSDLKQILENEGISIAEKVTGRKARTIRQWMSGQSKPANQDFEFIYTNIKKHLIRKEENQMHEENQVVVNMRARQDDRQHLQGAGSSPSGLVTLSVDLIDPNPYQPRKVFDEEKLQELADSILEDGLLQPIVARKVGDRWQLVAGERRLRATKLAGLSEILTRPVEMTDEQVATAALVENLQRSDVNALQTARAIERLVTDFNMTQADIGKKLGITQAKVSQALSLLKLIEGFQEAVEKGEISPSIARIIATLPQNLQEKFDVNVLRKKTVKEVQNEVNLINHIMKLVDSVSTEINMDDPIDVKFIKFSKDKNLIDIWETYSYCRNNSSVNKLVVFSYAVIPFDVSQRNIKYEKLRAVLSNIFEDGVSIRFSDNLSKDKILSFLDEFIELHFPIEDDKPTLPSREQEDVEHKENEVKTRETKEEREARIEKAQAESPVEILDFNIGKTKLDRLLKRIQEHQGDPIHEESTRCYNCALFDPEGKTYQERCKLKYGVSLHNFSRIHIEGEPDLFRCNGYTPIEEHVEKKKQEGMHVEQEMIRLILNHVYLGDVHQLVPELNGMDRDQIVHYFLHADPKTKAFIISQISFLMNLVDNRYEYFVLPNGEIKHFTGGMIIGANDI